MRIESLAVPATLLAATFALTGCSKTLDNKAAEDLIKKPGAVTGVTVTSASCPNDVEAKAGKTFVCDADTSDGKYKITVKIESMSGDKAHIGLADLKKVG